MALIECIFLFVVFAFESTASQQPDPAFNARVSDPAYAIRHPRALFDEAHNNSHTADGTYKPFLDLIKSDGYLVSINEKRFSRQSLAGYSVLIIVNATGSQEKRESPAFTKEECDAVRDWVQAGGSLLLVIDHAPFNTPSAELAARFSVDISPGFVIDKKNFNTESDDQTEIIFSRDNSLLLKHPITEGRTAAERVNRVITFSGVSVKGPDAGVQFLKLSSDAFDILRPEKEKVSDDPEAARVDWKQAPAGGRGQAVALEFEKGRVVVFGNAAALTAQIGSKDIHYGMNVSGFGNRQLALNIMHWLSRLLK